jgi:RecA-family ATPase
MDRKGLARLNPVGLDRLEKLISSIEARIVVLDPLYGLVAGGMNDNSVMGALVLYLKGVASRNNCAIMILHHTSKGTDLNSAPNVSMGAASIGNASRVEATLMSG